MSRMLLRSLPKASSVRRTIWGWQQLWRSAVSAASARPVALPAVRMRPCTR
jgi:anti-sigma-K factor RskA